MAFTNYTQSPFNKERKDKFVLVIPTPKFLKDDVSKTVRSNDLVNPDKVQFSIYGSVIPEVSVPEVEVSNTAFFILNFKSSI